MKNNSTKHKLKIICTEDPNWEQVLTEAGALKRCSNKRDQNSRWFLHGKLEDICGYDKGVIYNMDEFPEYTKQTFNWSTIRNGISNEPSIGFHREIYLNSIVPVEVYGIDEPCIGYFWTWGEYKCKNIFNDIETPYTIWDQLGLICLKSDKNSIKYALNQYKNKTGSL